MLLLLALLATLSGARAQSDCRVDPDSSSQWPTWPPILTDQAGDLILPEGEDGARYIAIPEGQVAVVSCPGSQLPGSWGQGPLFLLCTGDTFTVWLQGGQEETEVEYRELGCDSQPMDTVEVTGECGSGGLAKLLTVGFDSDPSSPGTETTTLTVCHDLQGSRTLWSRHVLYNEIAARDHGNDSPPFNPDSFFDYDVNHFYTMAQQKETIAGLVGSQELADKYIQDFDSGLFLARGHLSPNADFIFYSWMDSTYHFVNVAPQWQAFNGGNWMWFEIGVRDFAVERGLDLEVYTGTEGVCELEDVSGEMVSIHLYQGDRLPVPRFYWKIIYDPLANAGVAIIGVNNPHLLVIPPSYLLLCPALADHPLMDNIYHPEDIKKGFMWACRVEDLLAGVEGGPQLPAMDLLL